MASSRPRSKNTDSTLSKKRKRIDCIIIRLITLEQSPSPTCYNVRKNANKRVYGGSSTQSVTRGAICRHPARPGRRALLSSVGGGLGCGPGPPHPPAQCKAASSSHLRRHPRPPPPPGLPEGLMENTGADGHDHPRRRLLSGRARL